MTRWSGSALALLLAGCASVPQDAFSLAETATARGDLVSALRVLDAVPITHPRYPEARADAVRIEQQMRKSQELLLQGMWLRSEWRDREAIAMFERARSIWPSLPGVDDLIQATHSRMLIFGSDGKSPAAPARPDRAQPPPSPPGGTDPSPGKDPGGSDDGDSSATAAAAAPPAFIEPLDDGSLGSLPFAPAPLGETRPQDPAAEPAPQHGPHAGPAQAGRLRDGMDLVGERLAAIEARLSRGDLEKALQELMNLHRQIPGDARLRLRLARVLHQRALIRYGQGAVDQAIQDWNRALDLDPGFETVRTLLSRASADAGVR